MRISTGNVHLFQLPVPEHLQVLVRKMACYAWGERHTMKFPDHSHPPSIPKQTSTQEQVNGCEQLCQAPPLPIGSGFSLKLSL
jgi:hypothetical protein